MCSWNLRDRLRLVWPMYALLQVLHISLYIPFLLWSGVVPWFLGLVCCCIVFVLLKAILISVCLKRLVILLTLGLWYVKVAHLRFLLSVLSVWVLCWVCLMMHRNSNIKLNINTLLQGCTASSISLSSYIHEQWTTKVCERKSFPVYQFFHSLCYPAVNVLLQIKFGE